MNRCLTVLLAFSVYSLSHQAAYSQDDLKQQFDQLSERVDRLESVSDGELLALLFLFIGVFCALWAQNTKRNAWLWFVLGLIFNIITLLVLLAKNSDDRHFPLGEASAGSARVNLYTILGIILVLLIGLVLFQARAG